MLTVPTGVAQPDNHPSRLDAAQGERALIGARRLQDRDVDQIGGAVEIREPDPPSNTLILETFHLEHPLARLELRVEGRRAPVSAAAEHL